MTINQPIIFENNGKIRGAGRLLPVRGGPAILLGGHFQNLDCFGGSFSDIKGTLLGGSFNSYKSGI